MFGMASSRSMMMEDAITYNFGHIYAKPAVYCSIGLICY